MDAENNLDSDAPIRPNVGFSVAFLANTHTKYVRSGHTKLKKMFERKSRMWWGVDIPKQKLIVTPQQSGVFVVFIPVNESVVEFKPKVNAAVYVKVFVPHATWQKEVLNEASDNSGVYGYAFWCQNDRCLKLSRTIARFGEDCDENCTKTKTEDMLECNAAHYQFYLSIGKLNSFMLLSPNMKGNAHKSFNSISVPVTPQFRIDCDNDRYNCADLGFDKRVGEDDPAAGFYQAYPAISPSIEYTMNVSSIFSDRSKLGAARFLSIDFWTSEWNFSDPYTHIKLALILLGIEFSVFMFALLGFKSGFVLLIVLAAILVGILYFLYRKKQASMSDSQQKEQQSNITAHGNTALADNTVPKMGQYNDDDNDDISDGPPNLDGIWGIQLPDLPPEKPKGKVGSSYELKDPGQVTTSSSISWNYNR